MLFLLPLLKHGLLVKSITTLFVLNSLLVADSSSPNARWLRWAAWALWLVAVASNVVEEFHLSDALTFATKYVAIGSHTALFADLRRRASSPSCFARVASRSTGSSPRSSPIS